MTPILDMLRSYFGVTPLANPSDARERILAGLVALATPLNDDLGLLLELGRTFPIQLFRRDLWSQVREFVRLRELVGRIFSAIGQHSSLIIIEDIHWLDKASTEFVSTISEAIKGTHALMLVTSRTFLVRNKAGLQLPIVWSYRSKGRFSDIRRVVRDMVGGISNLDEVVTHVTDRAPAGNHFFCKRAGSVSCTK